MKPRRIVTVLAILAVTGAVSVPNSLAVAWRLDVSDRQVDRGRLEWNPLIYTQLATGVPPDVQLEYDYVWKYQIPEYGATRSDRSGRGEYKSGSAGEERQFGTYLHGNYFRNDQSSAFTTAPYSEMIYGGLPTTPSADPSVRELSREPSTR